MSDEPTLPPVRQPNTPRVLLRRAWIWAEELVREHPDKAIIVFMLAFAVALFL